MDISQNVPPQPKKRGRKPKNQTLNGETPKPVEKPPPKKRGRKPKGGKIISLTKTLNNNEITITNIILHLKCSLNDIYQEDSFTHEAYNPNIENVESYSDNDKFNELCIIETKENKSEQYLTDKIPYINNNIENINNDMNQNKIIDTNNNNNEIISKKEISNKINKLQHELNMGDYNVKSACFWCTEDFDTPTIYIPKNKCSTTHKYNVYGCFCSPECAAAHLLNENINDSEKFERYHLLNFVYGQIYNYNKNIKPAPSPHYTLSKFMGNLSINEYRSLFEYEKLILIIDKPLTRSIPQLFEDNDSYNIVRKNAKINTFKVRKNNNISKSEILNNNFGI